MADVVFASLRLGHALARLGQSSSFAFGEGTFHDFAKKGIPKGWGTPEEPVIASVAGELIFLHVPDEVVALFCEGVRKRGQIHAVHTRYEGKNVAMVELGTCERVLLYTDLLTVMYEAGFLFFTALDLSKELDCETLFFRKMADSKKKLPGRLVCLSVYFGFGGGLTTNTVWLNVMAGDRVPEPLIKALKEVLEPDLKKPGFFSQQEAVRVVKKYGESVVEIEFEDSIFDSMGEKTNLHREILGRILSRTPLSLSSLYGTASFSKINDSMALFFCYNDETIKTQRPPFILSLNSTKIFRLLNAPSTNDLPSVVKKSLENYGYKVAEKTYGSALQFEVDGPAIWRDGEPASGVLLHVFKQLLKAGQRVSMPAIWQLRKRSLSFFVCEPCEREDVEFFAIQATGDNILRLMSTSAQAMEALLPFIRRLCGEFFLKDGHEKNTKQMHLVFLKFPAWHALSAPLYLVSRLLMANFLRYLSIAGVHFYCRVGMQKKVWDRVQSGSDTLVFTLQKNLRLPETNKFFTDEPVYQQKEEEDTSASSTEILG